MADALIRVLVTGSRKLTDRATVARALGHLADHYIFGAAPGEIVLVHGDATGADALAADIAENDLGWQVEAHPADWATHGTAAGPARNKKMVALGAHYLVAFPGGSGTAHCRRLALNARIPVIDIPEARRA